MMSLTRRVMVLAVLAVLSAIVLAVVPGCGGSGSSAEAQEDDYRRGYEDGVKAEKAKWSDQKLQLARNMIEEQEASQENITRLLGGEVADVTVDEVSIDGDTALVKITARFKDGTNVPGTVDLVNIDKDRKSVV